METVSAPDLFYQETVSASDYFYQTSMDPHGILDENSWESLSRAASTAAEEFEQKFVFLLV